MVVHSHDTISYSLMEECYFVFLLEKVKLCGSLNVMKKFVTIMRKGKIIDFHKLMRCVCLGVCVGGVTCLYVGAGMDHAQQAHKSNPVCSPLAAMRA